MLSLRWLNLRAVKTLKLFDIVSNTSELYLSGQWFAASAIENSMQLLKVCSCKQDEQILDIKFPQHAVYGCWKPWTLQVHEEVQRWQHGGRSKRSWEGLKLLWSSHPKGMHCPWLRWWFLNNLILALSCETWALDSWCQASCNELSEITPDGIASRTEMKLVIYATGLSKRSQYRYPLCNSICHDN